MTSSEEGATNFHQSSAAAASAAAQDNMGRLGVDALSGHDRAMEAERRALVEARLMTRLAARSFPPSSSPSQRAGAPHDGSSGGGGGGGGATNQELRDHLGDRRGGYPPSDLLYERDLLRMSREVSASPPDGGGPAAAADEESSRAAAAAARDAAILRRHHALVAEADLASGGGRGAHHAAYLMDARASLAAEAESRRYVPAGYHTRPVLSGEYGFAAGPEMQISSLPPGLVESRGGHLLSETSFAEKRLAKARKSSGGVAELFPSKLYRMLEETDAEGKGDIVSFFPHGKSFCIHKPKRFEAEVMKKYFKGTRITSFQRQLNLYGFRRINYGPELGGYFHKYFLKGRPDLFHKIVRIPVKSADISLHAHVEASPAYIIADPRFGGGLSSGAIHMGGWGMGGPMGPPSHVSSLHRAKAAGYLLNHHDTQLFYERNHLSEHHSPLYRGHADPAGHSMTDRDLLVAAAAARSQAVGAAAVADVGPPQVSSLGKSYGQGGGGGGGGGGHHNEDHLGGMSLDDMIAARARGETVKLSDKRLPPSPRSSHYPPPNPSGYAHLR